MPGSGTRSGKRRALDAMLGKAVAAWPNTYVGLATADPGENPTLAGIAELTTTGYARQLVNLSAASDAATPSGSNQDVETWGPFSADPPSTGWAFLTDVSSGTVGEAGYRWKFDVPRDAAINDSMQAAIAALVAQLPDASTA